MLEPLQADVGIGKSRFGTHIEPSRGRIHSPVVSIGRRFQTPTVG